jgi:RNA polymerase sigma-70 factor (ECF subfamily)
MFGCGAGKYPTTRWTMVIKAGQDATAERDKALAELCAMYWTPVYGFIRAKGRRAEEARDLTQGFFTTRLIEKNGVAAADPTRGRFRNWLLTAVSNYLANDLDMARAKKRNPGSELISIDTEDAEGKCPIQIGHDTTPERVFERRWAMVLLGKALQKLEESYQKRGAEKLFAKMIPLLMGTGAESHRAIAEELEMREETFNVALSRCRSRFQEQIREEIAETVVHEDEIEDELRHLHSGLRSR